jgi:signal transduction histidine kinase
MAGGEDVRERFPSLAPSWSCSRLLQGGRPGESVLSDTTRIRDEDPAKSAGISPRTASRLAWSLWAACVVLIAFALLLDFLTYDATDITMTDDRIQGIAAPIGILSLVYPTMGALIVSRLPRNPIGWLFCGVGLLYAIRRFAQAYAEYTRYGNIAFPLGDYAGWLASLLEFTWQALAVVFLLLLFPDGRLLSRRWRIVAGIAICGAALSALYDAFAPYHQGPFTPPYGNPFGVVGVVGGLFTTYELFAASQSLGMALLLASSLAALFSLILRLRRTRGDERQQLMWFLYAAVPAVAGLPAVTLDGIVSRFTTDVLFTTVRVPWPWLSFFMDVRYASLIALLVLPLFTYIAILRHGLYDIDRLVNRTLVYGVLTACIAGIYVLAVGGIGTVFEARGNFGISLLAAVLVAVLFQPLRGRLQRGVDRLMYGERDDPHAVTSRLGRRLEAAIEPEAVLPTVTETIAQALKLPYVAILLKEGEGYQSAAAYGSPTEESESLPLVYQREEIGRLLIAPRAPGEEFSTTDRELLEDLARQAEVAVHAVRLTTDLQRSRERLVATREEERRRLRRDLHDGVGPTLASLALRLDAARKLVRRKPGDAEELLSRLKDQTQDTVGDVRRLVYGLRPPALDDLGLLAAVRQQAAGHGFVVNDGSPKDEAIERGRAVFALEASGELLPLPAAVEVAAYRIIQEAMTNVARHAHARTCRVRLSVDQTRSVLELETTDDGVGMPEDRRAGVGLSSMRERADELGGTLVVEPVPEGGTRVLARLPVPVMEDPAGERSQWNAPSAS